MIRSITQIRNRTAEQRVRKDLMDAWIAEQFFVFDTQTTMKLSDVPELAQQLYPEYERALIYVGKICFLIEDSYRQGYQWMTDSPIYLKVNDSWNEIQSPIELSQVVLREALSEEAYAHPGVTDFLDGLAITIQQLGLSLERASYPSSFTPLSAYDWHVKGEMISSLRDRPFHPLSKAKIGFTPQDYQNYMAEFGKETKLHWVAIAKTMVVIGCPEDEMEALDVLNVQQKKIINNELTQKAISKQQYTIIPVHPWQLAHKILPDFQKELADKTIIILDSQAGDFLATSSMRSFTLPYASTYMLKLPISVKSLGAARYLPVVKLLNGLVGEKMFRQAVACDETLAHKVFLCEEKHWWGYMPTDMGLFDDHPRHLAAQVRVYPQEILQDGYKIIPMASLGVALNEHHFLTEILGGNLSTEDVIDFYTEAAAMFYDITLRLFKVGIVPEIHGQNCCLVLKKNKVSGMLFRDHDSVRLHQPYLDKHQIQDPGYHIRPGYSNSLYNETLEKLVFYIQSLGTQVNLASIMEALSESYHIPEKHFWEITEAKLREALHNIDIPEADKNVLRHALFENEAWPVKLIIRPLLEADGVPGAMPSGKGVGHNPFYSKTPKAE
ncbi:IucA/IucC family siderophore biosynthesis protein [Paenibacillus psychroresistens]|uniref:IucA/IucC family siderophore biosynthesis protein n=1 Tax=Paenibacillus psychroresistens TaxID=1778678 RepID=A0A6B8RRU9_9BACL|nr:IucA/IucC family protein [Paenibacillus psychroresistens]QGQ99110.1 IucA/IucC family siderophore biosynthesis protein [Paenibacillus psychroresistens]